MLLAAASAFGSPHLPLAAAQAATADAGTSATTAAPAKTVKHEKNKRHESPTRVATNEGDASPVHGKADGGEEKPRSIYDFGLPTEDGKNLPLSEYRGKVVLIVNLGRESSYAAQLTALEKLSDTFKDKGLVVVGVPSNDFGNAEPGTPPDIAKYYAAQKITFPVMQVSTLTGVHELPLFSYLAKNKDVPDDGLHWNYTKFLIDRQGKLVACFPPEVSPDSLQLTATVQEVVDGTWKPKKSKAKQEEASADDDDDD